jgi:hypothetical protein
MEIDSHEDGLNKIYSYRKKYTTEIECLCLNSQFFKDIAIKLKKAVSFRNDFPDKVVLKESEFHSKETPYYELSVFCNDNEVELYKEKIEELSLEIDIIHQNQDFI